MVSLVLLAGVASAGTVTLTGVCVNPSLNSTAVNFTLTNSGNDTAYSLVMSPVVQNAQPSQNTYGANALGPQARLSLNVSFSNVNKRGARGAYFIVAYQQGGSVFTAVFPCLISFYVRTSSQVLLTPYISAGANGNTTVRVSAFNAGQGTIQANVSLMLPPTFTFRGSRNYTLALGPYQTGNVTFLLGFPLSGLQASYGAAAVASYVASNLSYATLATFTISAQKPASAALSSLILGAAALAVLLVLALIFVSLRRKKRR